MQQDQSGPRLMDSLLLTAIADTLEKAPRLDATETDPGYVVIDDEMARAWARAIRNAGAQR